MATADETAPSVDAVTDFLDRHGLDWVHLALANIVLLGFATRLYELGVRVAHWDEARVAYWTVRFIETGNFEYRPIIHGPFYHHVNRILFDLLGMSDFTMRLSVAVIGALFPLTALLLRDRLRDIEVVGLAVFFLINPVLLYYTRFMRGDPLVAMFMFAGFAFFVRAIDTGRRRHFLAGMACVAFGFTAKENALLYLVTWVGAAALLLDHRLFLAGERDRNWLSVLLDHVWAVLGLVRRHFLVLLAGLFEALLILLFFYAPRAPTEQKTGLWEIASVGDLVDVVYAAFVQSWMDFYGLWVNGNHQDHPYLPFLGDFLETFAQGALLLGLLALLGFLVDRYSEDGPRDVVSFAFYWGFVSILGYPIVTDVKAPWATLHAIVPLAVPAAVGLGLFVRWGRGAYADDDFIGSGIAVLALLLVFGQMVGAAGGAVYMNHSAEENKLIQYAQPADNLHPVMERLETAAAENEGPNVVLYGDWLVDGGDASVPRKPGCSKWFNALPLPWYFEATDASATCASSQEELVSLVETEKPALVIMRKNEVSAVEAELSNYVPVTYRLRAWGSETTFFVHEQYADGLEQPDVPE